MFALMIAWVLSSECVRAEDPSHLLGVEPQEQMSEHVVVERSPASELPVGPAAFPASHVSTDFYGDVRPPVAHFELMPEAALQGYSLTGSGLTMQIPSVAALGIAGRARGDLWRVGGGWSRAVYTGLPSTLSPTSVAAQAWNLNASIRFLKLGALEFAAGYEIFGRIADQTSPQSVVSNYLAHGPQISLLGQWEWPKWTLLLDAQMSVPWYFLESTSNSGAYTFGTRSRARIVFSRKIAGEFKLGIGMDVSVQALQFSGSGGRGTVNALDLTYGLGFPVVVQYAF